MIFHPNPPPTQGHYQFPNSDQIGIPIMIDVALRPNTTPSCKVILCPDPLAGAAPGGGGVIYMGVTGGAAYTGVAGAAYTGGGAYIGGGGAVGVVGGSPSNSLIRRLTVFTSALHVGCKHHVDPPSPYTT